LRAQLRFDPAPERGSLERAVDEDDRYAAARSLSCIYLYLPSSIHLLSLFHSSHRCRGLRRISRDWTDPIQTQDRARLARSRLPLAIGVRKG